MFTTRPYRNKEAVVTTIVQQNVPYVKVKPTSITLIYSRIVQRSVYKAAVLGGASAAPGKNIVK